MRSGKWIGASTIAICTVWTSLSFLRGAFLASYMNSHERLATRSCDFAVTSPVYPQDRAIIPLIDLVMTNSATSVKCPPGTIRIDDTILPESLTHKRRKIPCIIHITSKSRCTAGAFATNVGRWRLVGHSVFYHDEAAVDRLLGKNWPEFPHLRLATQCLISGAAKADLWRYLVLWEYGGIYSDIDAAPGSLFNETTILPDDDAWFIPEKNGILSQYFMSASPRHPLMYIAVMESLNRILSINSVLSQYPPSMTGPRSLKRALATFMQKPRDSSELRRVTRGQYFGTQNRSVTVEGSKEATEDWIRRYAVDGLQKREGYAAMGQTHFDDAVVGMSSETRHHLDVSCVLHLYRLQRTSSPRVFV